MKKILRLPAKKEKPENQTHVIDVRFAFKGSTLSPDDNSHLEEVLDRVREVGAAVILESGVLYTNFNDWSQEDLKRSTWEEG